MVYSQGTAIMADEPSESSDSTNLSSVTNLAVKRTTTAHQTMQPPVIQKKPSQKRKRSEADVGADKRARDSGQRIFGTKEGAKHNLDITAEEAAAETTIKPPPLLNQAGEIVNIILKFLPEVDLVALGQTCKLAHSMVADEFAMREIDPKGLPVMEIATMLRTLEDRLPKGTHFNRRVCGECATTKERKGFSDNQWKSGKFPRTCLQCMISSSSASVKQRLFNQNGKKHFACFCCRKIKPEDELSLISKDNVVKKSVARDWRMVCRSCDDRGAVPSASYCTVM